MQTFPSYACLQGSNYAPEFVRKKMGFGGGIFVEKDTFDIEAALRTEEHKQLFLGWWRSSLNYGTELFLITLPISGIATQITARMKTHLTEEYITNSVGSVSFTIERIRSTEYIVINSAGLTITNSLGQTIIK